MTIKKVVEDFFRNFFNKNRSLPFSIRMEETGMYYIEQFDFVEVDGKKFPLFSSQALPIPSNTVYSYAMKINSNGNKILVAVLPENIDKSSLIFV